MTKLRCVIADDSKIIRDRIVAYLVSGGYEVVAETRNGEEAYHACVMFRPDIVILDISMPVMNGDIAAQKIMKEKLVRFVVVASSQIQEATIAPLLKEGIKFISKPFKLDKFLGALKQIVGET